jgi:hypothetical protein
MERRMMNPYPRFTKALGLVLARALASLVGRFHIWKRPRDALQRSLLGPVADNLVGKWSATGGLN